MIHHPSQITYHSLTQSKPNSQIIVNCYENNTNKIIEVIDFGIGISKENIDIKK